MTQITMIVPEAHRADATALVMALGASAADWQGVFANVTQQDADGAQYAVACWDARDGWLAKVAEDPQRPDWDVEPFAVNVAGAERARALLEVYEPGEGVVVPQASADTILILVGNPAAMVAAAGLVRIVGDT
jgi:hypothetical protein